ncbi:zinc finger protein MAGPIE-like [Zingiber officinale]|uniref:zinc finger protein MAGPIE-like n=1 Tax=Zingiber officinale TaxID=94328 RepID=UPI001C4A8AFF|nr:zinc finger protein MAGPIE-like [Zingiber officinale]
MQFQNLFNLKNAKEDPQMSATEAISKTFSHSCNPPPPPKKKRNLPGTPDPEAEVIALSPRTLLASNRFVCEICGKGFQRDQNLQLHRRGHNLPWKLRQRGSKESRKRVYVCPEPACVHHNPSRALGDLTGIKKHFCRKHGEKRWKCDKCAKKYAVLSDWNAHVKTCGSREYRCDCGTLFSRRDSFITHRAFCDALAEETARVSAAVFNNITSNMDLKPTSFIDVNNGDQVIVEQQQVKQRESRGVNTNSAFNNGDLYGSCSNLQQPEGQLSWAGNSTNNHGDIFSLSSTRTVKGANVFAHGSFPSLFSSLEHNPTLGSDTSATALLQKAAQVGASTIPFLGSLFKEELGGETRDFLGVGMHPSFSGWL